MKKQLSVIIPVFNEKNTLYKIIKKVLAQSQVLEIIIIDDGSTDNCIASIKPLLSSKIRVFYHKKNQGKGAAMTTGLKKAKGQWVIFQDGDIELDPRDYPKLLQPLINQTADFVIGNRNKNNNGRFIFKLGSSLLTYLVNSFFGINISDSCCGFKVASLNIWQSLNLESKKFEIEMEIIAKVALKKLKITEVDVYYQPRSYQEGKKVKAWDVFRGIRTLLEIRFKSIYDQRSFWGS